MADIELVIKISEDLYKATIKGLDANGIWDLRSAVADGTPLPKGHGRLIDADAINVNETVGGANDFADCIREAVQTVLDNAPTMIVAESEG